MTKTLSISTSTYSIFLKDGFFDSKDPSYNTKISMYLDLIQIYGFRASQIAMDIKVVEKKSKQTYMADLMVYNKTLQPEIIMKVKLPGQYDEYINQQFTTDLFELGQLSKNTVRYLVLIYPNISGYIDQKDVVVIDYIKYKTFKLWKQKGFEHMDFIPMFQS